MDKEEKPLKKRRKKIESLDLERGKIEAVWTCREKRGWVCQQRRGKKRNEEEWDSKEIRERK